MFGKKRSHTNHEPKIFGTGIYDSNESASKGFSSKVSSFVVNLKDSEFNRFSSKGWVEANGKKRKKERGDEGELFPSLHISLCWHRSDFI